METVVLQHDSLLLEELTATIEGKHGGPTLFPPMVRTVKRSQEGWTGVNSPNPDAPVVAAEPSDPVTELAETAQSSPCLSLELSETDTPAEETYGPGLATQ